MLTLSSHQCSSNLYYCKSVTWGWFCMCNSDRESPHSSKGGLKTFLPSLTAWQKKYESKQFWSRFCSRQKWLNAYSLLLYRLYNGNTVGQQFGPKCCRGDRIGCGISPDSDDGQVTVFFTKNGKEVCAPPSHSTCACFIIPSQTLLCLNVRAGGQCGNRSLSGHSLPCRGDALSGRGSAAGPERRVGGGWGRRTDDSGQSRGWLELSSWCQTDWHSECSCSKERSQ